MGDGGVAFTSTGPASHGVGFIGFVVTTHTRARAQTTYYMLQYYPTSELYHPTHMPPVTTTTTTIHPSSSIHIRPHPSSIHPSPQQLTHVPHQTAVLSDVFGAGKVDALLGTHAADLCLVYGAEPSVHPPRPR